MVIWLQNVSPSGHWLGYPDPWSVMDLEMGVNIGHWAHEEHSQGQGQGHGTAPTLLLQIWTPSWAPDLLCQPLSSLSVEWSIPCPRWYVFEMVISHHPLTLGLVSQVTLTRMASCHLFILIYCPPTHQQNMATLYWLGLWSLAQTPSPYVCGPWLTPLYNSRSPVSLVFPNFGALLKLRFYAIAFKLLSQSF